MTIDTTTIVSDLFQRYRAGSAAPRPGFGKDLAHALFGNADYSHLYDWPTSPLPFNITEAIVGDERAAFFCGHRRSSGQSLLSDAASFAYHNSVEWCILTNFHETHILNSHWLLDSNWFALPPITSVDLFRNQDILKALTPQNLRTGRLEELIADLRRPDSQILPVDDALFERLDYWREETLRHVEDIEGVDEALHLLFVQLFVLRVVEDRRLAASLPPLKTLLDCDESSLRDHLHRIYKQAQETIQNELFSDHTPDRVPPFVLGGIVRDLYHPQNLPRGTTYNFAWIDAELLGRAYEKYVSTVLVSVRSSSSQLSLWNTPVRDVARMNHRKSFGVYYTPSFIVKHLANTAIDLFSSASTTDPGFSTERVPSVIDIACGSGSFLAAAADRMIKELRRIDPSRNWGRYLIENKKLIGIDIDPRAVSLARLTLWLRLAQEPQPLPLPQLESAVIIGDSLDNNTWSSIPKYYDIALGNPPFMAIGGIPDKESLRQRFSAAQGRFDYAHLFVEQFVRHLKEGGVLALVIPNRIFRNRDSRALRGLLARETVLCQLVDFGSAEIFSGTNAYVALIVGRKGQGAPCNPRYISFRKLPSRFPSVALRMGAQTTDEVRENDFRAYTTNPPPGEEPWLLLAPSTRLYRAKLENISEPLGNFARIQQGIKTGANDFFIVNLSSPPPGRLCEISNGLGDRFYIERDLLKPVIFGSAIRRYEIIQPSGQFLVYPYIDGQRLSEQQLRDDFPNAWKYLSANRVLLSSRSSIEASGRLWYELVRERDPEWLDARKLVMRDLATEPSFALDAHGNFYLVGGTAVVPLEPSSADVLLGYLNSGVCAWYLERATPRFQSGYQKFEPQHLHNLPVPKVLLDDSDLHSEFGDLIAQRLSFGEESEEGKRVERVINQLLSDFLAIPLDEVV